MMVTDHRIRYDKLDWEYPRTGVAQKIHVHGSQRIRLLRFSAGFVEDEWCMNGHVGFVLQGSLQIDINGKTVDLNEGDGLWIDAGIDHKHKVIVGKANAVELILFETA